MQKLVDFMHFSLSKTCPKRNPKLSKMGSKLSKMGSKLSKMPVFSPLFLKQKRGELINVEIL